MNSTQAAASSTSLGWPDFVSAGPLFFARILQPGLSSNAQQNSSHIGYSECGAVVLFEGRVREMEGNRRLLALHYEYHPEMAQQELERILHRTQQRFGVKQVACEHSTGRIAVQEASVAIAIGADHRQAAFEACQHIMNEIKKSLPIWKAPVFADAEDAR